MKIRVYIHHLLRSGPNYFILCFTVFHYSLLKGTIGKRLSIYLYKLFSLILSLE